MRTEAAALAECGRVVAVAEARLAKGSAIWRSWGIALLAVLALTGCPGTLDNPEQFLVDASVAGLTDAGDDGGASQGGGGTSGAAPSDPSVGGGGLTDGGEGGAAGDAGGAGDAGVAPCGESDLIARILQPSCGGVGCHGASAPQQGLDLVSPGLAARVVGVMGKECAVKLADPKAPKSSLLYEKLSPTPPCGAQMPLARPPLGSEDSACLLKWIGAQ